MTSSAPRDAPSGPRGNRANRFNAKDNVVDGSLGFTDLMQTAVTNGSSDSQLYSDDLVGGNRRGRGPKGGARGRGGR